MPKRVSIYILKYVFTLSLGVICSMIVILAVSFLTPVFYYIPKPALAAMVIAAVITMVDIQVPREIWKIKRIDMIPHAISFFGTFYQLEAGVLAGAFVALLIMVSREVHPKNDINIDDDGTTATIHMKGGVTYPGVEYMKALITKVRKENVSLEIVNVDVSYLHQIDYAVIMGFKAVISDALTMNICVQFVNVANKSVKCFYKASL